MSDSIYSEIQKLSPSAVIELFELDYSNIAPGQKLRFHAGTNELKGSIIWQGLSYDAAPIEAEGFDMLTKGAQPTPKLRIANLDGLFSAEVRSNDDFVGAKLIRKRTFAKFLDSVNFSSGSNPAANPSQAFPDEVWYVEQKVSENRLMIEWELSSVFDFQGVMLPSRQLIQNSCPWRYRGGECGWTGGNFDDFDNPSTAENDKCGKRLSSCKVRFGENAELPFGGFPGLVRY